MNAQQLKNSILQEAIEGRLVPQDPNDEPASVLLDKIRKEKAKLVKEKKIRSDKNESYISLSEDGHWMEHFEDKKRDEVCVDDEIPFSIPDSWKWVRLRGLVSILGDGLHGTPEYDMTGKYYFINGNNLSNNKIVIKANTEKVNEEEYIKYEKELNDKTILVSINGTIGNVGHYNGEPVILGKSACYFNLMDIRLKEYVTLLMYTDYFLKYAKDNATGSTIKNVSLAVMNNYFVPLPPLAEQKRIVAKIEELLPKVDEYGKAQESLDKLNESLPERLKKSILQEAIEGRLVPQDPNDEPASALLDKIRKEKARLVKEGKLKKKDLVETPIEEDEIPFKIPESWEWSKLGEHISATSGLAYKKDDLAIYSNEYVRVLRGGNISFGSWCVKDDDVMIGKQFVNEDLFLKKGMFISPAVTSLEHMGKTALIREDQNNVVAGGFVLMFIPHYRNEIYWEYLNILFQTGYYSEKCKSITNKSGQAFFNLSRAKLLDLPIPLPPLAEQKRIVAKIEQLMKEVDKLKV